MPAASIRARRSSAGARRSAAMPVAGLPTATALVRSGYRAAKCSAMAPPTATPASATLPAIPKLIEQGRDVVGHRIEGKLAAHLLRQSGAAGVVAQHPARFCEPWRDVVPAFERAAHFVNQHQRAVAAAAQLAAQAAPLASMKSILRAPRFLLIFLFVTASDLPVSPEIRGHDTGDGINLKFLRCGSRRPCWPCVCWRGGMAAGCR